MKSSSLFWKIQGNYDNPASFLFGTIHLIPQRQFFLPEILNKALKRCTTLYLEMNIAGKKEKEFLAAQSLSTIPLSDKLSPEQCNLLDSILQEKFHLSLEQVNNFHPMIIVNMLMTEPFEEEMISVESHLIEIAVECGIKIKGLETARKQMKIGNEVFTPEELIRLLTDSSDSKEVIDLAINSYLSQDITALAQSATDPRLMPKKAQKILLNQRNKAWAKKIPLLMEKGPAFFAVGAGHLGGQDGLIELLRNRGMNIQPIKINLTPAING